MNNVRETKHVRNRGRAYGRSGTVRTWPLTTDCEDPESPLIKSEDDRLTRSTDSRRFLIKELS